MDKWISDVCEWRYDPEKGDPDGGIAPGTPFEDIPEDCLIAGFRKKAFQN